MKKHLGRFKKLFLLILMTCFSQVHASSVIDSLQQTLSNNLPDSQRIETHILLYKSYMDADMRDDASKQLNKAFELATKTGDKSRLAQVYLNLWSYNNTIDNYIVALANLMEALRLFREIKFPRGEAASLMNIGITYYTIKEYSEALN